MKTQKELVLATYWGYLKHFGREKGRKKWREYKDSQVATDRLKDKTDEIIANKELLKNIQRGSQDLKEGKIIDDLEPIQKAILGGTERVDIRKTKVDISECGYAMIELIRTPAWNKWLKPQIQKDAVDFVRKALMLSGEESHKATGGYNYAQKILRTINKWVADYTYLLREEEKKQNASRV